MGCFLLVREFLKVKYISNKRTVRFFKNNYYFVEMSQAKG